MRTDQEPRRFRRAIWPAAVGATFVMWAWLAILVEGSGRTDGFARALRTDGGVPFYIALLLWGWRRGGGRQNCFVQHRSRMDKSLRYTKFHRGDFASLLAVTMLSGLLVVALAIGGAWEAAALPGMFPPCVGEAWVCQPGG